MVSSPSYEQWLVLREIVYFKILIAWSLLHYIYLRIFFVPTFKFIQGLQQPLPLIVNFSNSFPAFDIWTFLRQAYLFIDSDLVQTGGT